MFFKNDTVQFTDNDGNQIIGKVEQINEEHQVYRIRTSRGTLYSVSVEHVRPYIEENEEPEEDELIPEQPLSMFARIKEKLYSAKESILNSRLFPFVVATVLITPIAMLSINYTEKTQLDIDTENLNQLNIESVPLIESCVKLSEIERRKAEVLERINALKPKK